MNKFSAKFIKTFILVLTALCISHMFAKPVNAASPASPYGMNIELFWISDNFFPENKWTSTVQKMASAGVKYVRVNIYWPGIQRTNNSNSANWNWTKHDRLFKLFNDYGISPLGYFYFTPDWAHKDPGCTRENSRWEGRICAPDPAAWEYFIKETVKRYGCNGGYCYIKYWELWNEPNLTNCNTGYFCGSLDDYFEMLHRGHKAIKETDRSGLVLIGGLNQFGIQGGGFLDLLLAKQYGGKPASYYFDILNFHYYYTNPSDTLNYGLNPLNKLVSKYNLQAKPIWITELNKSGFCNNPADVSQTLKEVHNQLIQEDVQKIFWFKCASKQRSSCEEPNRYRYTGIISGDTYEVLGPMYQTYQDMTGFSNISPPPTNSPPTNTPTSTPIPIRGDADGDGIVDGIDYVIWLNNYDTDTTSGAEKGDFDINGSVDGVDYVIWLNNYTS